MLLKFQKPKIKNKDLVVDIGSNDGVLLKYFKKKNVILLVSSPQSILLQKQIKKEYSL